jgi:predicted O-methyltransferase YrrM
MTPAELDVKAPVGAFSTFDQEITAPFIKAIPKDGKYLEIGVDKGKSLWIARQITDPSVEVFGVDICEDPKVKGTTFFQRDSKLGPETNLWNIDVLFIDGDHSYEGCKADIDAWFPFVKEGGVIMFHDCDESSPGVVQAVAEFVNTHAVVKWDLNKNPQCSTSVVQL